MAIEDSEKQATELVDIIDTFISDAEQELQALWSVWEVDLSKNEVHEVVAALLARQVSLAAGLAIAPESWTGHIAPIVLRAMADVYISLAWILEKPDERAKKFIEHGLGQEKLMLEHRKEQLKKDGRDPTNDPMITEREDWINSQRYTFLTEVNIGSWSGLSTRTMAEEAGCLDFYNYVYTPFSCAVHSMWNHIGIYNLKTCKNPLHRYHHIPDSKLDIGIDVHYLYLVAKYLNKAIRRF